MGRGDPGRLRGCLALFLGIHFSWLYEETFARFAKGKWLLAKEAVVTSSRPLSTNEFPGVFQADSRRWAEDSFLGTRPSEVSDSRRVVSGPMRGQAGQGFPEWEAGP